MRSLRCLRTCQGLQSGTKHRSLRWRSSMLRCVWHRYMLVVHISKHTTTAVLPVLATAGCLRTAVNQAMYTRWLSVHRLEGCTQAGYQGAPGTVGLQAHPHSSMHSGRYRGSAAAQADGVSCTEGVLRLGCAAVELGPGTCTLAPAHSISTGHSQVGTCGCLGACAA